MPRDSDTIVSSVQTSRVAHWQILLNVPLLCLSGLHSRSLSRQRFSLPAVLAIRSMHSLSESPIQNSSFALACMLLSSEMYNNYGMCTWYTRTAAIYHLPNVGLAQVRPRLYIEVDVYTRLTVPRPQAEATVS